MNTIQTNTKRPRPSVLQAILIALLMLVYITDFALAKGQKDSDSYRERGNKEHRGKNSGSRMAQKEAKIQEYFSGLAHGNLSEQERADLVAMNAELANINSLRTVLMNKVWTEMQESTNESTSNDMDKSSGKYLGIHSSILTYVAGTYDLSLETIDTTSMSAEYEGLDLNALIAKSEEMLILHVDNIQVAFGNADDEDIKTVYKFLQRSAIRSLDKLGAIMLKQGNPVSQAITDTINNTVTNTESAGYDFFDHSDNLRKGSYGGRRGRRGNKN